MLKRVFAISLMSSYHRQQHQQQLFNLNPAIQTRKLIEDSRISYNTSNQGRSTKIVSPAQIFPLSSPVHDLVF